MKLLKTLCTTIACAVFSGVVEAQQAPFTIKEGLFDLTDQNTAGLEKPEGLLNVEVFVPTDDTDHYSNQAMMAAFKGVLHLMWQNSPTDEDTDDTWVAWSYSKDNGETWSQPAVLARGDETIYCTSGGWLVTEDTLVAYINIWHYGKEPLRVDYMTSTDGFTWSDRKHVTMADGTDLGCEFGQDPHILKNGRILCSGHFPTTNEPTGKFLWPIYTDDPMGVTGWKKGNFNYTNPSTTQSRELEPSFYLRGQDSIVMTMRDQRSSYYILASVSTDNGKTWSPTVQTLMPDSRSKQCAGNLPDGTAYIVNNPYRINKPRCPLAITLSKDGYTFTHSYLLRGLDDLPEQKYSGWAKTLGYSYPKAMIHDGYLWVSYSIQKERVGYSRIPLSSLIIKENDADKTQPSEVKQVLSNVTGNAGASSGEIWRFTNGYSISNGHGNKNLSFAGDYIKFSRKVDFVIEMPENVVATAVEFVGYTNAPWGTGYDANDSSVGSYSYISKFNEDEIDIQEDDKSSDFIKKRQAKYGFPGNDEKDEDGHQKLAAHKMTISNSVAGAKIPFYIGGTNQICAIINIYATDASATEKIVFSFDYRDGMMYNVAGQNVTKSYKGIVVQNGKKYLNQ